MVEFLNYIKSIENIVGENKGLALLVVAWFVHNYYPKLTHLKNSLIEMTTDVKDLKKDMQDVQKQVELIAGFVIDKEGEKVAKRIRRRRDDTTNT